MSDRYTSTGSCIACLDAANKKQSLLNQSTVRKRRAEQYGDPNLYSNVFPIEWHDVLNRLRMVMTVGTDSSRETLRGMLEIACTLELARETPQTLSHSIHLTRSDLNRFFTFGDDGMPTDFADYPITLDLGPGTEMSAIMLAENWYEVEDLLALVKNDTHRISPVTPPDDHLP